MFGRSKKSKDSSPDGNRDGSSSTDRTLTAAEEKPAPTRTQVKRATRARLIWSLISSFLLLVSIVFLILVEVGNTQTGSKVLNNIYFIKLNLTNIIPQSVPESGIINSIAQTLGLHDWYQVGLWSFCEGYNGQGVVACSKPQTLYWFDPVSIILNELLAGATSKCMLSD